MATPGALDVVALARRIANPAGIVDEAGRLAVELVARLAPWGAPVTTTVRWRVVPAHHDPGLRRHPAATRAALAAELALQDRLGAVDEAMAQRARFVKAMTAARAWSEDDVRDLAAGDVFAAAAWARAVELDERVSDHGPKRVAGVRFADLPDPFAAALALWATGCALGAIEPDGAVVIGFTPAFVTP